MSAPAKAPAEGDSGLLERRRWLESAFAPRGALSRVLPGFQPREGQAQMALAVFDAICTRSALAAEAGTGTGKTLAYLLASLAAGGRVLVCAATRALQEQIFHKDIPVARAAWGEPVRVSLLKGRQNYLCPLRLERTQESGMLATRDDVVHLAAIARFAARSESGDRGELAGVPEGASIWPLVTSTRENCLGAQCPRYEDCFVVKARRRAQAADIVVANHHLLLADMSLRESAEAELLPRAETLIVDEAHHLARMASEFFGEDWSLQECLDLAADAQRTGLQHAREGAAWVDLARRIDRAAREVRLALGRPGGPGRGRLSWTRLLRQGEAGRRIAALETELAALAGAIDANRGREAELDLLGPRTARLRALMGAWVAGGPDAEPDAVPGANRHGEPEADSGGTSADGLVRWVAPGGAGARFHATPLRCDEVFARAREEQPRAWIFTSATLTSAGDFGPFVESLALQGAQTQAWASPFDYRSQGLLYLPAGMPDAGAPDFPEQVAHCAWPLVRAAGGRAFVLCSTLRAVDEVARHLRDCIASEGSALRVLVQGESARLSLLDRFREGEGTVLVGSVSFWEGVDVRGEALSLVVIDKLPFAPPDDPLVAARIAQLRARGRDPFREYQLPEAITLLRQGAGRLIRDAGDRGVLSILDGRILSRPYGRRILASLPPFPLTRSEEEACRFLAAEPRRPISPSGAS